MTETHFEAATAAHQARLAAVQARLAQERWEEDREDEVRRHAATGRTLLTNPDDPELRRLRAAVTDATATQRDAEQAAGGRVYRVPIQNVAAVTDTVAKLARRAVKLGLDAPTVADAGQEIAAQHSPGEVTVGVEYHYLVLAGHAPQLAGWTFIAVLEHDHEAPEPRAIIRCVPQGGYGETTETDLTAYRTAEARCEHCDTARRRNDTYLVQSEAGEIKQVGSSCLADFTGHPSPDAIARLAEQLADLAELAESAEREEPSGGSGPALYPTVDYLTFVAQEIRLNGWTPRSVDPYAATADRALDALYAAIRRQKVAEPETVDSEVAEAALAWVREQLSEQPRLSDFEHNLIVVLDADYLPQRRVGIAAAAINAYRRDRERQAEVAEDPGHVGQIKERIEMTVTVVSVRYIDQPQGYGTTSLYKLRDTEGHRLAWFSSRDCLNENGTYRLRGTVKSHETWQDQSETHLTRCKVLAGPIEPQES